MGNLMMSDDLSKHQKIANHAEELSQTDEMPVIVDGTVEEYVAYWRWLFKVSSFSLDEIAQNLQGESDE